MVKKIVTVLERRGPDLTVKVTFADVDPAGIVTCRGVPDNAYKLALADPPGM